MISYTLVVGLPTFLFFLAKLFKIKNLEKLGLFLLSIMLGLRYNFGVDYSGYYVNFNNINIRGDEYYKTEPAFYYLNILFGNFSFNTMLFFIAVITLSLFYYRIKNYEHRTMILFIFLIYSGSYLLQIVALRQGIAAMIFFFSIEFINQRNFKKYFLGILIATLFHNSAIILLFVYFLKNVTRKALYIELVSALILANYYILHPILSLLEKVSLLAPYMMYLEYTRPKFGSGLGFLLSVLFPIILIYFYNRISDDKKIYYHIFILSYIINILGVSGLHVHRFEMYFSFFAMIAIPEFIYSFKDRKTRFILKVFITTSLIVRFYMTIYGYQHSKDPLAVEYLSEFKFIINSKDQWKNVTGSTFLIDGLLRGPE